MIKWISIRNNTFYKFPARDNKIQLNCLLKTLIYDHNKFVTVINFQIINQFVILLVSFSLMVGNISIRAKVRITWTKTYKPI